MQQNKTYNDTEKEIIFLYNTSTAIDSILNYDVLSISHGHFKEIRFPSYASQSIFHIRLIDLFKHVDKIFEKQQSCLSSLHHIIAHPKFNHSNSLDSLNDAYHELHTWLNKSISVEIYLSEINITTTINIKRIEFLIFCGNFAKHSHLNLTRQAEMVRNILRSSDIHLDMDDVLTVLPDFYSRFNDDILLYHSTTMAELSNNIRHGIHTYLYPEHSKALMQHQNEHKYSFRVPESIQSKYADHCYWKMMNLIRRGPILPFFIVDPVLKLRY